MSLHAIAGLIALNLWFLAVGEAVLFGVRGWDSWSELLRLSGLAYVLGVATLGVTWTWGLVAGLRMGFVLVFATGVVCTALALALGRRLGRRLPRVQIRRPSWRRVSLGVAACGALTTVYLEAPFRSGRPR